METGQILGLTFGVLGILSISIVTIVVVWQGLASWRAIKMASRDDAYRRLAENLTETLHKLQEQQEVLGRGINELRERNQRIEQLLKQVE